MHYILIPALVLLLPIVQAQQALYGQCMTSMISSKVQSNLIPRWWNRLDRINHLCSQRDLQYTKLLYV